MESAATTDTTRSEHDSALCGVSGCDAPAHKRCTRCGKQYYCSKEHQAAHWQLHRKHCKKDGSSSKDKRGGTKMPQKNDSPRIPTEIGARFFVDAFLLPVDGTEPKVVKAEFEVMREDDSPHSRAFHMPRFLEQFDLEPSVGHQVIQHQSWNGPPIEGGQALELYFRDNFTHDGSPINQCVRHLTGGDPGHNWAGNMVVIKHPRAEPGNWTVWDGDAVTDVVPEDIKALSSYLRNYGRTAVSDEAIRSLGIPFTHILHL